MIKTYRVEVEVRPWKEGGFLAEAPALQGCWVVADTLEAAIGDIQEVIAMAIESRLARGESLPPTLQPLTGDGDEVSLALAVSVR